MIKNAEIAPLSRTDVSICTGTYLGVAIEMYLDTASRYIKVPGCSI